MRDIPLSSGEKRESHPHSAVGKPTYLRKRRFYSFPVEFEWLKGRVLGQAKLQGFSHPGLGAGVGADDFKNLPKFAFMRH
jgi:hypothetical protein